MSLSSHGIDVHIDCECVKNEEANYITWANASFRLRVSAVQSERGNLEVVWTSYSWNGPDPG